MVAPSLTGRASGLSLREEVVDSSALESEEAPELVEEAAVEGPPRPIPKWTGTEVTPRICSRQAAPLPDYLACRQSN